MRPKTGDGQKRCPALTLEDLEAVTLPEIMERGRGYWLAGNVHFMQAFSKSLMGTVQGSMGDYHVKVEWSTGRLTAVCDCPYRRGFCKHAAALAWGWLNNPERFLPQERVIQTIDGLSSLEMRECLKRLAHEAPGEVAKALGLWQPVSGLNLKVVQGLAENLERGDCKRPEWLVAWRRVLGLLEGGPEDLDILNRLVMLGIAYLRETTAVDLDFIMLFCEAFQRLCQHTSPPEGGLPEWWSEGWQAFLRLGGEERRRLRLGLLQGLGLWTDPFLETLGYPPKLEQEEFGKGIDFIIGWLLLRGEPMKLIKDWTLFKLERSLAVMDLLAEEEAWNLLKDFAREGLRRAEPQDRFIFRSRLALAHRRLGEPRQGLPLLISCFQERPGWEEYLELAAVAEEAAEPNRALITAQQRLRGDRIELLAKILIHEDQLEALAELAPELPAKSPVTHEAAKMLSTSMPELAKTLWEREVMALLEEGSRKGVKAAMPFLIEIKRLCRENGWAEAWEAFRALAAMKIMDPVAIRMTALLLAPL